MPSSSASAAPAAEPPLATGPAPISEKLLIFLVGAVQFVNILDFMMVMPLGPDFARALGMPLSRLGIVGGSYTAAAAISGLIASLFLERFDRRSALAVTMTGLVLATGLGGLANTEWQLVAARILAGAFGGPASALALSVVADVIPPARRGKAMGAVMGAFAAASVLGVPAGLKLAELGSWRTPFFAVAGLGALVAAMAVFWLPSLRGHIALAAHAGDQSLLSMFRRREVQLAMALTLLTMAGSFSVIPNISGYVQFNLAFPRADLGQMYLLGGVISFFATRLVGSLIDKFGSSKTGIAGCIALILVTYGGFYATPPWFSVPVVFGGYFLAMAFRNVPYNVLMSLVPGPAERARFMSLQSSVQHLAASLGAFASSKIVSESGGKVVHMDRVAAFSIALTLTLVPLFLAMQAAINQRKTAE
jgi:predicted MFS family arabinose efflux permease